MANLVEMMIGGAAAGVGFVLGAGGALVGAQKLRPAARKAIKGYIVATERAREMTAELAETIEDIYAEARAEREAEIRGSSVGGPPTP